MRSTLRKLDRVLLIMVKVLSFLVVKKNLDLMEQSQDVDVNLYSHTRK